MGSQDRASREQFEEMVAAYYGPDHHQGDGPGSRLDFVRRRTLPILEATVGPLRDLRVLDFGCGSGSSTLPIAERGAVVTGFDIDADALGIAAARLGLAGFGDVAFLHGPSAESAGVAAGSFDLAYLNAVIERVPRADRPAVLADVGRALRPGGLVVIAQTPNRWWPRDVYLTGRWFVPWTPVGSALGARLATRSPRLRAEGPGAPHDPASLERRGLWGVTYPELLRALPTGTVSVDPGPVSVSGAPLRRRVAEGAVRSTLGRWFGWPGSVVSPMFSLLVFRLPR